MELWWYVLIRIVKSFVYKTFASLCCAYLGAAPIPYVQDIILNPPNPDLRSTTLLLDNQVIVHVLWL